MNFRYPIFLDLTRKRCVVAGQGVEIAAKIRALLDASADVVYVNPTADEAIQKLARAGMIEWEQRDFAERDLDGCFLVITGGENNADVFRLAEERNVLCNSVDDPKHCRFSFGSVHRQGDLSIAISTNGRAPALAVRLREKLQHEIGPEYALLLHILEEARKEIRLRVPDFTARRRLWYRIVDSEALYELRHGDETRARAIIRQLIEEAASSTSRSDTSGDSAGR